MHIALLTQHYRSPDCASAARHYSFLKRFAPTHDVTLLTTDRWHKRRKSDAFDWVPPGVNLHMMRVPYHNAMGTPRRLGAFLQYAVGAFLRSTHLPQMDLIIGVSTPLTAALAASLAARVQGVPWIFEVHDLWPDFPIQMGAVKSTGMQRTLRTLERRLYRDAAHVVTLSPDMERHARRFTDDVTTVEYGADFVLLERISEEDVQALRQQHDLAGRRVVLYAGTFGRANAIPMLLEAARRLQHRADTRFVFAGAGYYEDAIREAAACNPIVKRIAPQPYHRALALFKAADVSLVPFIDLPVLATNAPSKFYDSLAAGTPVVVTNPGWTKALVERERCGWYVPAGRPKALADHLAQLLDHSGELQEAGRRGAHLAAERFERARHMDRLATLVEDVVAGT